MITVHLSERVTLFHGDALRVLATLPDAGVELSREYFEISRDRLAKVFSERGA